MRINFKGEGEVTAADIVTDGTVEILNPDLHIATVSEGGQLIIQLKKIKNQIKIYQYYQ